MNKELFTVVNKAYNDAVRERVSQDMHHEVIEVVAKNDLYKLFGERITELYFENRTKK